MRFRVNTQDLNAAITTVTKALSSKTTLSILEGIYIEAAEQGVLLRCTDLSLQIESIIAAEVEEEGAIVLPGRLFADITRRLPGESTEIHCDKNTTNIVSGRARSTVQGQNATEFHIMPSIKREYTLSVSKSALKSMIRQTLFATAQDESKPILTGVYIEASEDTLSMVALDGYRLALRKEGISFSQAEQSAVVPAKSLQEIGRIVDENQEDVQLVFSRTHMLMDVGHTKIMTRLLDGEFIKYRQILPEGHTVRVRVNRSEMLDSIERVALMAREGKSNLVKFAFADNALVISANSELGKSDEQMDAQIIGPDLEIAFNSRYFIDVLRNLEDEQLYLDMNNNISPCVVRPVQGERFYYLVLPVRLFSGI